MLTLDGPSMRTKHLGLDDPTAVEASHQAARGPDGEVIRISGIDLPEFPEPTQQKLDRLDEAFLNAFCRAHQTCRCRRLSTTNSDCSSCSSRKESRSTEIDSIEPRQRHHF